VRKSQVVKLYLELGKNLESFRGEIIKRGFSKIDEGAYKLVYSKNKLGYVVKIANSGNDEFAPIPQEIKKYYLKPYFCDNQVVVQKRAKTKNGANERTFNIIKKELGYRNCEMLDVSEFNCGEINNKPVLFDFAKV
tara:strand:- start:452 stop:859 length:408 start_codon:yes stop_codon:yes gene_type:complete